MHSAPVPYPAEIESLTASQTETKNLQSINMIEIEESKGEHNISNADLSNQIKEEKSTEPSPPTSIPTNVSNLNDSGNKMLQILSRSQEQIKSEESSKLLIENNAEAEKKLKASGTCEGEAETMNLSILTNTTKGDTTAKTQAPSSSKKNKKKKPKARESLTRRRTRHSGRLSSEHSVENSMSICAGDEKKSSEIDVLEGMALQIENAKKKKIPGLEKLLKGQYAVEGIWPIAGRRVFPTVGNIPPSGKSIACFFSYANFLLNFNICSASGRNEKDREKCWFSGGCELKLPYKSRSCAGILWSYLEKESQVMQSL